MRPDAANIAKILKTQAEHSAALARILEILEPKPEKAGGFASTEGIRVGTAETPETLTSKDLGLE